MGLRLEIKTDDVEWTVTYTYRCSNCNTVILERLAIKSDLFYETNWDNISPICPCGERLLVPITKFVPVIDELYSKK